MHKPIKTHSPFKKSRATFAAALATAAVLATVPGAASAATVSYNPWSEDVEIVAAPGETNTVSVSIAFNRGFSYVQIADTSAPLELASGSFPECGYWKSSVVCDIPPGRPFKNAVSADLGDGNDEFSVDAEYDLPHNSHLRSTVEGGAGNDRIVTGEGDDLVNGGSGNDYIAASDGANAVHGDSGNDFITGGNSTSSSRSSVFGDEGDDLIVGSNSTDTLNGGEGNDFINARNGDDNLDGGPGTDNLLGAEGDDSLRTADGERDILGCGVGFDIYTFDSPDDVSADCELLAPPPRPNRSR